MADVAISIKDRIVDIQCEESQVEHVRRLGRELDGKAREIARRVGAVPDYTLLVMTMLQTADELSDARAEIEKLRSVTVGQSMRGAAQAGADEALAAAVESMAERLTAIAERLETP